MAPTCIVAPSSDIWGGGWGFVQLLVDDSEACQVFWGLGLVTWAGGGGRRFFAFFFLLPTSPVPTTRFPQSIAWDDRTNCD